MGIKISPKEFARQWRTASNRMAVVIWNLETELGKSAASIFKQSFYLGRMNTASATAWRDRTRPKPHAILNETGTLRDSITLIRSRVNHTYTARVYTNPNKFKTSARHRGFCYAAVHNAPDGTYSYGKSGVPSVQRQFMGHSTLLNDRLNEFGKMVFDGFLGK